MGFVFAGVCGISLLRLRQEMHVERCDLLAPGQVTGGRLTVGFFHLPMMRQCVKTNSTPVVHIKIAGIYGCE